MPDRKIYPSSGRNGNGDNGNNGNRDPAVISAAPTGSAEGNSDHGFVDPSAPRAPIHGAAMFQRGCRCSACSTAEQARVRHIGHEEERRWRDINLRADQRWQRWRIAAPDQPDSPRKQAGTRWTAQQLAIALNRTLSVEEAASRLGRSNSAVASVRTRYRYTFDRRT